MQEVAAEHLEVLVIEQVAHIGAGAQAAVEAVVGEQVDRRVRVDVAWNRPDDQRKPSTQRAARVASKRSRA